MKRPADVISVAVKAARLSVADSAEPLRAPSSKVRSGIAGGKARAAVLTPERKREIAAKAPMNDGDDLDYGRLETIVRTLLEERFPETTISRVVIRSDEDSDGDSILRITVVVASDPQILDRSKMLNLTRLLRPQLAIANSNGFPVMSFVAERDVGKLNLEAA